MRTTFMRSLPYLVFGLIIFASAIREQNDYVSAPFIPELGGPNAWDTIVASLNDPYVLIYFAIPYLLIANLRAANYISDPSVLLRHGSKTKAAVSHSLGLVRISLFFLAIWFLVTSLVGTTNGWSMHWSGMAMAKENSRDIISAALSHSVTPIGAVIVQIAALLVGVLLITTILIVAYLLSESRSLLRWLSVGMWLFIGLSFWRGGNWPDFLSPINYLSSVHAIVRTGDSTRFLLAGFTIFIATIIFSRFAERIEMRRIPHSARRWVILGLVLLGSTLLTNGRAAVWAENYWEEFRFTFLGVSADGFNLIPFFFILLTVLGPAFVLHAGFVDRLNGGVYAELIRHGSAWRWMRGQIIRAFAVANVFTIFLIVTQLVTSLPRYAASGNVIPSNHDVWVMGFFFATTVLSIVALVTFMLGITWGTGRTEAGLWAIGVVVAFSIPPLRKLLAFPAALNSLAIFDEGNKALFQVLIVLSAWVVASAITVFFISRRSDVIFT